MDQEKDKKLKKGWFFRHKLFVQEYLANGQNATEAYLVVYPNCKRTTANVNSSKILKLQHIQEYIAEVREKKIKKAGVSKDYITEEILETLAQAKFDGDNSTLIKTLDMLNKMYGHYVDKKEIEMKGVIPFTINYVKPNGTKDDSVQSDT